ncbi:hypothetical protein I547_1080 [Mycobacterium kansasii 824]|nr:hypothetical protein I547_1080 [Mycobacterium kansasii 824]
MAGTVGADAPRRRATHRLDRNPAAARVNAGISGAARDNDLPMLAATSPPSRTVPTAAPATAVPAATVLRVPAKAARSGAATRPKPGRRPGPISLFTPTSHRFSNKPARNERPVRVNGWLTTSARASCRIKVRLGGAVAGIDAPMWLDVGNGRHDPARRDIHVPGSRGIGGGLTRWPSCMSRRVTRVAYGVAVSHRTTSNSTASPITSARTTPWCGSTCAVRTTKHCASWRPNSA